MEASRLPLRVPVGRVVPLKSVARLVFLMLAFLSIAACARPPRPTDMSGFLDDYSKLREGPPEGATLVYRNDRASWARYDKILFEPVTIWRSGTHALDDVPEDDLLRLADEFEIAVRSRLEPDYRFVDQPGQGVMRLRLGITAARQSDHDLDVFEYAVPPDEKVPSTQELAPTTRALVVAAAIEGELTDAVSGELLAAGVDRRGERNAIRTWGDVRAAFDRWAAWLAERLRQRRTGQIP